MDGADSDADCESIRSGSATPTDDKDMLIRVLKKDNKELRRQISQLSTRMQKQEEAAERRQLATEKQNALLITEIRRLSDKLEKRKETVPAVAPREAPPAKNGNHEPQPSTSKRSEEITMDTEETVNNKKRTKADRTDSSEEESFIEVSSRKTIKAARKQVSTDSNDKTTDDGSPTGTETSSAEKIPPVVLRKQEKWSKVSRGLTAMKINYTKARLIGGTIQIHPTTIGDHRKMTNFLANTNEEYHTYSLPEDKQLRVVMRGIPEGVPTEEIKSDLEGQGFTPSEVLRMHDRRAKRPMPLVLIKLPVDQEKALLVNRCCSLVVKMEKQRMATRAGQCYRCQKFGHSQKNCAAIARCVKCAANHAAKDCPKPRAEPPKCANCGGAHPASYLGCPKQPKHETKKSATAAAPRTTAPRTTAPTAPETAPRSFAEATRGPPKAAPRKATHQAAPQAPPTTTAGLGQALAQMQQMCAAMQTFFAQCQTNTQFTI